MPRDGERVADSLPTAMIEFLDAAAAASGDRSVALPYEVFRDAFANTADGRTAAGLYARLVPSRTARSSSRSRCQLPTATRSRPPMSPAATIARSDLAAFIPASPDGFGQAR